MCRSMVDIQSAAAEIRRGKKKDRKNKETTGQKYNVRSCIHRSAIIMTTSTHALNDTTCKNLYATKPCIGLICCYQELTIHKTEAEARTISDGQHQNQSRVIQAKA